MRTAEITNIARQCPLCGDFTTVSVYNDDLERYHAGALAQDAFPYLSADDREIIISGICVSCWDKMFDFDE